MIISNDWLANKGEQWIAVSWACDSLPAGVAFDKLDRWSPTLH